jgi:hypothetical protein
MMIRKLALTLCGVTLGALGLAAPAQAGEWRGVDSRHDVAAYKCAPACHWKPAPANADADMVSERVTYRHESIRIAVKVRNIDLSQAFTLGSVLAKTDLAGRYYGVLAEFSPGKTPRVLIRNPHGTPVDCGAANPRVVGQTIKVVVPARCLHSPSWIRWTGYTRVNFPGEVDPKGGPYQGYYDKFRTSSQTPLNPHTFEFSRRIYRAT